MQSARRSAWGRPTAVRFGKRWSALIAGTLLAAVTVHAGGQDLQPPTFRSGIELIEVPVLVTDGDGRPVTGLTAGDFEVFEDGRRQSIRSFAAVDLPLQSFTSTDLDTRSDVASNAHGRGRLYLIVLDDLHINARNTAAVRQVVRDFLREHVYRNDLVGIVQTGGTAAGVQELTNDRARLLEALDSFTGRKLPQPPAGCADPLDLERAYTVGAAMKVLGAMTTYLSGIRGRKASVLFVSEGIDYDIYDAMGDLQTEADAVRRRIDEAIATAQRNNVVIYSIDPRGLFPRIEEEEPDATVPCARIDPRGRGVSGRLEISRMSPLNSAPSRERARRSLQSLRQIAEDTGGFAATDGDTFGAPFSRIVRENTQYYVIGYSAPDRARDGRFRRLEVRVRRPGVIVRARKGYTAPRRDRETPTVSPTPLPEGLAAALESPAPVDGLTLRAQAVPVPAADGREVIVVAEIDGRGIELAVNDGRHTGALELALLDIGGNGRPGQVMQQRFDMRLTDAELARLRTRGLRAIWRAPVDSGRHHLRLAARDVRSGKAGSVTLDVEAVGSDANLPAIAGVLLTSPIAAVAITPRSDAILSALVPGPPTLDEEFFQEETLTGIVPVAGLRPERSIALRARLLSASGGEVLAVEGERLVAGAPDGGMTLYGFTLPLHRTAPGTYVLSVELERDGMPWQKRARTLRVIEGAAAPPDLVTAETVVPIAHGPLSERRDFAEVVVRDPDAWQRLWRELPTRQPAPDVDFRRFMVVGVFLGERPGPHPQAAIVGIRREPAGVVVLYSEGDVEHTADGSARPFVLVGVERTDLPIRFERVAGRQP